MLATFDGVFSPATCGLLHNCAASSVGHRFFRRGEARTLLSLALDSYLDEMEDSAPVVECAFCHTRSSPHHVPECRCAPADWTRQRWMHIAAHADIDEFLAEQSPELPFRYPIHGHVLYLAVGSLVRGPTCVWDAPERGESPFASTFTTVPAVAGRILRFDGSLQHAVPRPASVWLDAVPPRGFARECVSADDFARECRSPDDFARSVVLFNTWQDAPHLKAHDDSELLGASCQGRVWQGSVLPGAHPATTIATRTQEQPEDAAAAAAAAAAQQTAAPAASSVRCTPQGEWVSALVVHGQSAQRTTTMSLWLLGDEARRSQLDETHPLAVDGERVRQALEETSTVTVLDRARPCDSCNMTP